MKGPSFQFDQRILRVWICPACGRSVRTPGAVTSRTCNCTDPPTGMKLQVPPGKPTFDVSQFVSPDSPEFDDDDAPDGLDEPTAEVMAALLARAEAARPPRETPTAEHFGVSDDDLQDEFGGGLNDESVAEQESQPRVQSPRLPDSRPMEARSGDSRQRRDQADRNRGRSRSEGRRENRSEPRNETRPPRDSRPPREPQPPRENRPVRPESDVSEVRAADAGSEASVAEDRAAESEGRRSRSRRRRRGQRGQNRDGEAGSTDQTMSPGTEPVDESQLVRPRHSSNDRHHADGGHDERADDHADDMEDDDGETSDGGSTEGGEGERNRPRRRRNRRRGRRRGQGGAQAGSSDQAGSNSGSSDSGSTGSGPSDS